MTSVQAVEPLDVSMIRDNGAKALVLLARSLHWNLHQKNNAPITITAPGGAQRRIPTDTSIRIGVFQSHLSAIIAHSIEWTPTIELIDRIVKIAKPNDDQARRMRLALGESPQMHRERMNAHDNGAAVDHEAQLTEHINFTDEQLLALEIEQEAMEREQLEAAETVAALVLPPTPSGGTEERHIVSTRQARAITSGGWQYETRIAIERTWSDNVIDFECAFCHNFASTKLLSVAGHWKWHVQRGEVEKDEVSQSEKIKRANAIPPEPGEPVTRAAKEGREAKPRIHGASDMIHAIRQIVGNNVDEAAMKHLRDENERLKAENRQLRDDWEALQELIGRGKR